MRVMSTHLPANFGVNDAVRHVLLQQVPEGILVGVLLVKCFEQPDYKHDREK